MSTVLRTPLSAEKVRAFAAGDVVYLSGVLYTMRDKAHAKILSEQKLPFSLHNACIYPSGPLIVKDNKKNFRVIAAGPTTSARMNEYTPALIERGVTTIVGKGGMSRDVAQSFHGSCFYLAFTGGCGVLAREKITEVSDVYYLELGVTEAVWKFRVRNFGPLLVGIDARGRSLYDEVRELSKKKLLRSCPNLLEKLQWPQSSR